MHFTGYRAVREDRKWSVAAYIQTSNYQSPASNSSKELTDKVSGLNRFKQCCTCHPHVVSKIDLCSTSRIQRAKPIHSNSLLFSQLFQRIAIKYRVYPQRAQVDTIAVKWEIKTNFFFIPTIKSTLLLHWQFYMIEIVPCYIYNFNDVHMPFKTHSQRTSCGSSAPASTVCGSTTK